MHDRLKESIARYKNEGMTRTALPGLSVGYDSPSQFSREYRRMFGVPPSRDALLSQNAERPATRV